MILSKRLLIVLAITLVVLLAVYVALVAWIPSTNGRALRVALAPYQDMALLVNHEPLGLDKKYGITLDLVTVSWSDLVPAVASAGKAVDVSFGGLLEYLNKAHTINAGSKDPVLYIFPLYAFKGGALVTFNKDVPDLTHLPLTRKNVNKFLGFQLGFPKHSVIHMLVSHLASQVGLQASKVNFVDIPYDDTTMRCSRH
jgi:ABC-type nitrate/sulfonate/bicarbonate transport system substrate-binding protein